MPGALAVYWGIKGRNFTIRNPRKVVIGFVKWIKENCE